MRRGERDLQRSNRLAPDALANAKNSPMHILRTFAFLSFLVQVVLAQEPTPVLPDSKLTPGDAFDVTAEDLCVSGYAKKVRNVPAEMKLEVYAEYAVTSHGPGDYEVDHLIPLELGGSNSIKNLWPESHRTLPWNAQVKDRLEGKLHKLVCSGQLDLKTAQQAIASNWIEAYKTYVDPNPPTSRLSSPIALEPPVNSDQIWVNTRSGKYWKPNSRYYGKTKQGKYMPEKDAVQKGYRPANGTGE
jgi:hypothetical protein